MDEPLYDFLINDWKERSEKQGETLIKYSESLDDAVSFSEIDFSIQNLIIFDNMIVQKNLKYVEELFIQGRKSNCSVIFINRRHILKYLKSFVKIQTCFSSLRDSLGTT